MAEISIIVPVYKAEAFLGDCIGSILAQTFSDFELLLVDDGSPDNCLAICQAFAGKDSRIRVFHQENQGQAAARNLALQSAAGDWVCFVDSDDRIHPQMVQLLYQAAKESGAPISQCRMLEAAAFPEGFDQETTGEYDVHPMDETTLAAMFDHGAYPAWVACGKLIRRELVEAYPFVPGRVYEDNEAVCHWVCQAGKLADIPKELYFYRGNPDSTTQKAFSRKRLDYLWALESIIRYYGSLGYAQLQQRFCGLYAESAADYYRRCCHEGWEKEAANIRSTAKALFFRDRIPLTQRQFEIMLDAFHPKLIALYWPCAGVMRRLKKLWKGA